MEKKTKKDLVDILSQKTNIDKKELTKITDAVFGGIKSFLLEGSSLEIRGFGTFKLKLRNAKKNSMNPKTGEKVESKAHYIADFKPGIEIKEKVKQIKIEN